jgi:anti-sigma-K factor RskA
MTEPQYEDLIELATPYALHAVSDAEVDDIEQLLADAPPELAHAFADEVRAVRETMALLSTATAIEPPDRLRERLLAGVQGDNVVQMPSKRQQWRTVLVAAAAAVVLGVAGVGTVMALRPEATQSTAEQVFAAPDVRTISGDIPTGGTATVVFSREKDAGVLVMNNVDPPAPGTVYQMWLVHGDTVESAGTMDDKAVSPSTTAVLPNLDGSDALAFTVEPGGGSTQPTGQVFATLPLI